MTKLNNINFKGLSKRVMSLVVATTMMGTVINFSGCSNQNEDSSAIVDSLKIDFNKDQNLYDKIVNVRNDVEIFIDDPFWQNQVVVLMSDSEENDLKNKILNTLELFDDFISSWDNGDDDKCSESAKKIVSSYLEDNDSKYLSFSYFYKFLASKEFPENYDIVPTEVKDDEPFTTYNVGNKKIFYVGNIRNNSLIDGKKKNIEEIINFYGNIIENLTNTYLYILSEDKNALGVLKKDELKKTQDNLKSSILTYAGFDSEQYGIYMNNYGEWDIYNEYDIYETHVPYGCDSILKKMNEIVSAFENKSGNPYEVKIMIDGINRVEETLKSGEFGKTK